MQMKPYISVKGGGGGGRGGWEERRKAARGEGTSERARERAGPSILITDKSNGSTSCWEAIQRSMGSQSGYRPKREGQRERERERERDRWVSGWSATHRLRDKLYTVNTKTHTACCFAFKLKPLSGSGAVGKCAAV